MQRFKLAILTLCLNGAFSAYVKFQAEERVSDVQADKTGDVFQPAADQFTTTVQIGTPPQEFTVLINMDSAVLWVPDATCGENSCAGYCKDPAWCYYLCPAKCCAHGATPSPTDGSCESRKKFTSTQSSTYQKNGTDFEEQLTTPAVGGFTGLDFVTLGKGRTSRPLTVKATFGQATEARFDDAMKYDGVFGLSFARDAPNGTESPLMTAYRHGLIDYPIWTLWLTQESSQGAGQPVGQITYGAVDATNCDSKVDYFDVEPYHEYNFLLPLFSVSLGNYTAEATDSVLFAADLDISSSYALEAGPSYIRPLANAAGAKRSADGTYTLPCDAEVKPLVLEFARLLQLKYEISKKELVLQTGSDSCKLNVKEVPLLDGTVPRLFVVGSPLAREYCTVHDIAKRQFGFAKKVVY